MFRSLQRALPAARQALPPPSAQPAASRFVRLFATAGKGGASAQPTPPVDLDEGDILADDEVNLLEGKRSRDSIHAAFSARSMDVIRYDYFAQRAELEAEMEAAAAFRSLVETAKQQAMGYLELMEEYGDAGFGSTIDNLDVAAATERDNAEEVYRNAANVAEEEQLEQVQEWFEDMAAASSRASERLELVSSMMDAEGMDEEVMEDDGDDIPEKAKH